MPDSRSTSDSTGSKRISLKSSPAGKYLYAEWGFSSAIPRLLLLPCPSGRCFVPMTAIERRLAARFDFKLSLCVRIPKSAAPERSAESLNVSAGGICFATDLPLQKGTPVHLVFAMPEEISHKPAAEWHCTGHVVHVQPGLSPQGAICAGVAFDCYEVFPLAEDRASNAC
ncbi:MAG: hypothetical protein DMG41_03180 [Acidobacteria bacterium]|nr:MAG: hypothetical protein DMG42_27560 [Acidobacteriota bacterium]PYT90710.1 MAG: hypothetical protein DMG41_03180 [Acidobacteriota bacterium]